MATKLSLLFCLSFLVLGCENNIESSSGPVEVSSLSSGSESLSHQAVYEVLGSGFGEKDPVAPFFWDDLSSSAYSGLSDGDVIPTRKGDDGSPQDDDAPWWDQGGFNLLTYATSDTRVVGHPNYRVIQSGYLMDLAIPETEPELFLSYWFRGTEIDSLPEGVDYELSDDGDPLSASNKMMRIWPEGNNSIGHISTYPHRISYDTCCTAEEKDSSYGHFYDKVGQWAHLQMLVNSTGFATGEATLKAWQDSVQVHDVTDLWGNTHYYILRLVGWEPNRSSYYAGQTYELGDIYVDVTQARIQICNEATWDLVGAGAHCEMQIPTDTWSDAQLSFTANQGNFSSGEAVYLYIVNLGGVANQLGVPVLFE